MIKLSKNPKTKHYDEQSQNIIKTALSLVDSELQDIDAKACTARIANDTVTFSVGTDDNENLLSLTVNYPAGPETYDITPLMTAQIDLALDTTPAIHVVDPAKQHQDFIDKIFSDDDYDGDDDDDDDIDILYQYSPFSCQEFIDCMSAVLYRCEATVKKYIHDNPHNSKIMLTATNTVKYVFMKDDCLMAHMFDNSDKKFIDLTIGQFIAITDELLYRAAHKK